MTDHFCKMLRNSIQKISNRSVFWSNSVYDSMNQIGASLFLNTKVKPVYFLFLVVKRLITGYWPTPKTVSKLTKFCLVVPVVLWSVLLWSLNISLSFENFPYRTSRVDLNWSRVIPALGALSELEQSSPRV